MFMTYKKRPYRMCDDDYICQSMEMVGSGGGVLQLHCESGNIIEYLENKLLVRGAHSSHRLPVSLPRLGRGGGHQPGGQDGRGHQLPYLRGAPEHPAGPGTHQAGPGLTASCIWTESCPQYLLLVRRGDGHVWVPLAKIGPAPASRRRSRPGRPVARTGTGPHRPSPPAIMLPSSSGTEASRLGQHFRGPQKGRSVPFGSPGVETIVLFDVQRR